MQSKQLSTNVSAVLDFDAVVIICVERRSQIHGIRPLNKLTAGDVHRTLTLCKQKQTSALCATNGERNAKSALDLPFKANKVRTFRNYQLCVYFNLIEVKSCGAC